MKLYLKYVDCQWILLIDGKEVNLDWDAYSTPEKAIGAYILKNPEKFNIDSLEIESRSGQGPRLLIENGKRLV